jgi:PAS domain S-box-containing protein
MVITFVLIISILLQLTAAFLALRLMWVTEKKPAWVLIAVAISLMALRRCVTLHQVLFWAVPQPLNLTAEFVGLVVSILMVVGIAWIAPLFLSIKNSQEALRLNESRLEALWKLSKMTAAPLQEIADFTLEEAVRLTKSKIGFVGLLNEDETVLSMQSWSKTVMDQCGVIDKPIVYPLENAGLWGEAVRQRRPIITNDYAAPNSYKKGYPEGHVKLHRFMAIPVFDGEGMVAVASVANKEEAYDETDVRQLGLLMDGMWRLIRRKRAEEALTHEVERGHRLQAHLIHTCMDGIIANDTAGNILIFNENAAKILGYSPEEVIGKINVVELYPPGKAREIKQKIYDPALGEVGILENYETVVRHKDGILIPIWLSARLLQEEGRDVGIIGHFRDLRERKRMEEELVRNERLAALGKMVAHITHEIKNPLAVIGGFSQKLEQLPELPKEARSKLHLIHEEVQRLEKFLADLGSFTRTTPTHKTPGDLVALIREVAELMEAAFKEKGVVFQLLDPPPLPPILFDSGQIRQVLINIFKNALEAMPQGGRLTVGLEIKDGHLNLTVADTGHGISPEHLQVLFTPFFSTKERGTGLGLTICRGLIEQHQGEIKIDSEVDRGTTCTIRLPLPSP